jgi:hypothetical protein
MSYHPSLLHPKTIERISMAQVSVSLSVREKLQIALEEAERGMVLAKAADHGDLWIRCWRRAEDVRAQMKA